MQKNLFIFIPVILIVVAIPISIIFFNKEKNKDINGDSTQEETINPEGTIVIEAGEGTLVGGGSFSYISESARGLEAYLAEQGASAIYTVNTESGGIYSLWVKLSDDGLYENSTRDASIVINNSKTLVYKHVSEDTKGWKWYEVGVTPLVGGSNTFVFTKNESSAGAYVMDEFKLIPQE